VITTAAEPQRTIIGSFLVLMAIVAAVVPMPLSLRSAAVALFAYLAFAVGGMAYAYLAALIAPALGLVVTDAGDWVVMLPIILSGNLLAMLGLEFAWRLPALLVSPALLITPAIFVRAMAGTELFRVDLPWGDWGATWIPLHALVGVMGVLIALLAERQRERSGIRLRDG
jgi:hypothetical protein